MGREVAAAFLRAHGDGGTSYGIPSVRASGRVHVPLYLLAFVMFDLAQRPRVICTLARRAFAFASAFALVGCTSAAASYDGASFADFRDGEEIVNVDAPARWQDQAAPVPSRAVFEFSKFDPSDEKHVATTELRFLPGEPIGSRSLGRTTGGRVYDGVRLAPEGPHWRILTRQRARGLNYGSGPLAALIEDAAARVGANYPESTVLVGNIGAHEGGAIPYSVSHHNGRDADLAFFATDPEGRPVDLPDLLAFQDNGRSFAYDGFYRFDAERNWALVVALIESEQASLQYLFVSNGLKALLMNYARSVEVDAAVLAKADIVLRQPSPRSPHDDHFHVRTFCTADDIMVGCEDFGAIHAWAPVRNVSADDALERAVAALAHPAPAGRSAALERLLLLEATGEALQVIPLLEDGIDEVRAQAADTLATLIGVDAAAAIGAQLFVERDVDVAAHYLRVLSALPSDATARVLASFVMDDAHAEQRARTAPEEKGAPLALYALDALSTSESLLALPALASYLTHDDSELRARAADAIAMVANQRPSNHDWRAPLDDELLALAVDEWVGWVDEALSAYDNRLDLALAGLRDCGYETPRRGRDLAASLAHAAGDARPFVRYNAQRMLMAMTPARPASLEWPAEDARAYWTRWVERNPRTIVALR